MTYELKSNKGNEKNYVFTSAAAAAGVRRGQPRNPAKKRSVSAQVKKKPQVKRTAKTAVKEKAKVVTAVREAKPNVHTVRAAAVIPIPAAIIVVAVLITVLFMTIIISFVNINEFTITNDKLEAEISTLEKEYKELALSLERKNNLREIERYAKEELGMVKLDQLKKQYITIDNEDKIEVIDTRKSAQDILSGLFENINKNIKTLVEYIE